MNSMSVGLLAALAAAWSRTAAAAEPVHVLYGHPSAALVVSFEAPGTDPDGLCYQGRLGTYLVTREELAASGEWLLEPQALVRKRPGERDARCGYASACGLAAVEELLAGLSARGKEQADVELASAIERIERRSSAAQARWRALSLIEEVAPGTVKDLEALREAGRWIAMLRVKARGLRDLRERAAGDLAPLPDRGNALARGALYWWLLSASAKAERELAAVETLLDLLADG